MYTRHKLEENEDMSHVKENRLGFYKWRVLMEFSIGSLWLSMWTQYLLLLAHFENLLEGASPVTLLRTLNTASSLPGLKDCTARNW